MRDATRIEDLITTFIVEEIAGRGAVIDPDENIFTSGHVDSVGIMRLIAHLESALDVTIPPTELVPQNFRTVRVMAAYLASRAS
ncbi:MAG: acyl carrier protein [Acidobacteriota bacterium]